MPSVFVIVDFTEGWGVARLGWGEDYWGSQYLREYASHESFTKDRLPVAPRARF